MAFKLTTKKAVRTAISRGIYVYSLELNKTVLLKGLIIVNGGNYSYGGKRKYYPQTNRMHLENGWRKLRSGYREEGKWGYIPELDSVELIDGIIIKRNAYDTFWLS